MILKINYLSGTPAYKQIIDGVKEEIALQNLKPMDELPSVRNLALQLKVNPNTVARAYRDLISDGIIYSRQGMGFYVKPFENKDISFFYNGLKKLLIESKLKNITPDELLECFKDLIKEVYDNK